MVRYPLEERRSLASLETMRIRTPDGQEVPFSSVADVKMGKSLPAIRRIDRNRSINVRADVDYETADLQAIRQELIESYLPDLLKDYPATTFVMEGEAREQRESFSSLWSGMICVLLLIYGMLAIPFKSYLQPIVVMSVIPFGLIGAILGHLILGYYLSVMSLFGCLALSGVVVNDSLVMVDYINRRRRGGQPLLEAVSAAGMARFRPILLTSLTTFAGLTPLMLEESRQARFLIPMAISLAFGVLFATFITLFTVPANYLILEDARRIVFRLFRRPDLIDPEVSTSAGQRANH
jgi:multidrug efflux pump subunit AcrB